MNEQEIMQAELDIAKFMGKKIVKDTDGVRYAFVAEHMGVSYPVNWSELKYRKDWNALMPVVEKIEAINDPHHGYFGVHIISNTCNIQGTNLHKSIQDPSYGPVYMTDPNAVYETKIQSTYAAVLAFIKWYNEVKK